MRKEFGAEERLDETTCESEIEDHVDAETRVHAAVVATALRAVDRREGEVG